MDVDALVSRLYAALRHEKSCTCGECSGGLNAVDALAALARQGAEAREALRVLENSEDHRLAAAERERDRLNAVLDRVINAGVETWHTVVNDEPQLSAWLGLTDEEYGAWVEGGADRLARAALADVGGTEDG